MDNNKILEIKKLTVNVFNEGDQKIIVNDVSLEIVKDSVVGLVGGSGSGKSTVALSILNLLPKALTIDSGKILFLEKDVLRFSVEQLLDYRGKDVSMVFQEPLYAFNPVFTIGNQIEEVLAIHTKLDKNKRLNKILELLSLVEIKDPKRVFNAYPHQLSGGMRQRAMIAQAIASNPKLLIADEPTSNLDVTIQARIISLFNKLKKDLKLSILLITHDLGIVREMCDKVYVMKNALVVESGSTDKIFFSPKDNYTKQLIESL